MTYPPPSATTFSTKPTFVPPAKSSSTGKWVAALFTLAVVAAVSFSLGMAEGRYQGREAATDCAAARSYDNVNSSEPQAALVIEFAQQVARDVAPYCFGASS